MSPHSSALIGVFLTLGALCLAPGCRHSSPELVTRHEPGLQAVQAPEPNPIPVHPFVSHPPLDAVLLSDPADPIVNFRIVFRAGSVDDPPGREGLTALTAALMAQGGTQKLSASQLLEFLFPLAAELDASTSKELTVFEGRVHRDHLEAFFPLFTDVLLSPRWDPKEFERLRQDTLHVIQNSLRSEDDETLSKVALDALLYQGHPYGHFTLGTVEGLKAITLDEVKAHAKAVFTQDRAFVGLAGAADAALQARLQERLAALPAQGKPMTELPPAPGFRQRAWIFPKETLSTAVTFGASYPLRRGDPDFFAVAFALSYLGEHRQFNGVLFNELREKRGLNYGDYAYAEHFAQEGWGTFPKTNIARRAQNHSVWIRPVENPNAVFATRGALYYLHRLLEEGIPQDAFNLSRGFLTGYTRLWEQTAQRRLGYAIDAKLYGTPHFLESYRQAMSTLTPEAVHAAVRRHLSLKRLNFVFVTQDGVGLQKVLLEQPPTPHRYLQDGALQVGYPTPKPTELLAEDEKLATQPLPVSPTLIEIKDVGTFMQK